MFDRSGFHPCCVDGRVNRRRNRAGLSGIARSSSSPRLLFFLPEYIVTAYLVSRLHCCDLTLNSYCFLYSQRSLYRLEPGGDRPITFADTTKKSKAECETILKKELEAFPYCQIVGVEFPFFDEGNKDSTKYRPCVALYGEEEGPALFLSIYMGAPRSTEGSAHPWELFLEGGDDGDLYPATAPTSIVDVSKMCAFPTIYDREGTKEHGKPTWNDFYIKSEKIQSLLASTQPKVLRETIIETLIDMMRKNRLSYVDTTRKFDEGSLCKKIVFIDGEYCTKLHEYHYNRSDGHPSAAAAAARSGGHLSAASRSGEEYQRVSSGAVATTPYQPRKEEKSAAESGDSPESHSTSASDSTNASRKENGHGSLLQSKTSSSNEDDPLQSLLGSD